MSQLEPGDGWPRALQLDDEDGPAAFLTRARADELVRGALERAGMADARPGASEPGRDRSPGRSTGVGRRSSRAAKPGLGARSLAAAAVVALLSIGSASAAVMWWARTEPRAPAPHTVPAPITTRSVAPRPPRAQVEVKVAPPAPVEPEAAAPLEPRPTHSLTPRAPEDWLAEGNRLRAERRWAQADAAYARAASHAPGSPTAYVAQVASAALRLEHLRDPRGARARYRNALRLSPDGALGEEIHWGLAEAERALGDHAAEQRALQLFVRQYPGSPLLGQARARLD